MASLNPLKRVNSILTLIGVTKAGKSTLMKVSIPSNGSIQFLQITMPVFIRCLIVSIPSNGSIQFLQDFSEPVHPDDLRLNPLKRVNSILTASSW
mgnify:CR=1 FL=1